MLSGSFSPDSCSNESSLSIASSRWDFEGKKLLHTEMWADSTGDIHVTGEKAVEYLPFRFTGSGQRAVDARLLRGDVFFLKIGMNTVFLHP